MTPQMTSDFLLIAFIPLTFVIFAIVWAVNLWQRHSEDIAS